MTACLADHAALAKGQAKVERLAEQLDITAIQGRLATALAAIERDRAAAVSAAMSSGLDPAATGFELSLAQIKAPFDQKIAQERDHWAAVEAIRHKLVRLSPTHSVCSVCSLCLSL